MVPHGARPLPVELARGSRRGEFYGVSLPRLQGVAEAEGREILINGLIVFESPIGDIEGHDYEVAHYRMSSCGRTCALAKAFRTKRESSTNCASGA
jgi:hypothetical protein